LQENTIIRAFAVVVVVLVDLETSQQVGEASLNSMISKHY